MEKTEAIRMGREWLVHSPPFDRNAIYYGCTGMTGAAGFVCRECCIRITGRGCNLKAIANVPIWEPGNYVCSLCEPELPSKATFKNVSCSQCGRDFGPGEHGFSHCSDHDH